EADVVVGQPAGGGDRHHLVGGVRGRDAHGSSAAATDLAGAAAFLFARHASRAVAVSPAGASRRRATIMPAPPAPGSLDTPGRPRSPARAAASTRGRCRGRG